MTIPKESSRAVLVKGAEARMFKEIKKWILRCDCCGNPGVYEGEKLRMIGWFEVRLRMKTGDAKVLHMCSTCCRDGAKGPAERVCAREGGTRIEETWRMWQGAPEHPIKDWDNWRGNE